MRVALLGAGRIGRLHARLLSELPGVELTISDTDPARAADLANEVGGRAPDLEEALAGADALPLAGHAPAPPHEAYIPVSGGLFRDFSIHDFDVIRWLTGDEVAEVFAVGAVRGFEVFAKYGDVDTAVGTLPLADGAVGAMTVARHDPLGADIRAAPFGSRDSVSAGLGPHTPMRSVEPGVPPPAGPAWRAFPGRCEAAYRDEFAAFLRVARRELASPCTAADGLAALRVAEAATLSLQQHRPVRVA